MSKPKIRRALISVYDKTGIVDFARALVEEFGIEIISTGGTAALLKENDIPVTLVEEITGFPEMLDGRVKTLHPKIHAAILADRDNPDHMRQLKEQGIEPIDMVVVNLYPFEKTVADPNCTFEQAIEMIDIGGPCLLRAAAKNHKHVALVPQTVPYEWVLEKLRNYSDECHRRDLHETGAWDAFCSTAHYDSKVAMWIKRNEQDGLPDVRFLELWSRGQLRYGENPHQHGEVAAWQGRISAESDLLCSKVESDSDTVLSFNNYADGHAALELCKELTRDLCGTGLQPVKKKPDQRFKPLEGNRFTRRNLPHIQTPGRTYFVTFRLSKPSALSDQERDIVLGACRHWDREKLDLHAVVVMPDHVHLLLTPLEQGPERWVTLGEIVHSIKRHAARKINELRGRTGPLWQDEYFERIIRNEKEYEETWNYIANNPIKNNLAKADEYRWFWDDSRREELSENHTTNTIQAHRLKTGATRTSVA
ncbi:MAG: transposase, partial [Planctomycetes bacterium]|nr:transposase [Planctomycetota bacterium]